MLEKWAAEQQKMWAEHVERQEQKWTEEKKRWADEDARKWAERKPSLHDEASQWRDATEVRPERLERGETAPTVALLQGQ